jgi:hypothetical protein
MIILLPPSEAKLAEGGKGIFSDHREDQVPEVEKVLKYVKRLKVSEQAKVYKMKPGPKIKAAHQINLDALNSPVMPALQRYTGVVYQFIDYETLKLKRAAQSRLYIVSAMFGLISGGTKIPNYKLSMTPWLTKHWRNINVRRFEALKKQPVLSLLSTEFQKALPIENLLHVDFRVQGGKKAAGHFGKAIKGRFVRFLIENKINNVKDFSGFTEDGYKFDGTNFIQK